MLVVCVAALCAFPALAAGAPGAVDTLGSAPSPAAAAAPVVETAGETAAPVVETAGETAAPVVAPVAETAAPVVAPVAETAAPVVAPVAEIAAPVVAPVAEIAAPVVAPVAEIAAPVVDGEAPITPPLGTQDPASGAPPAGPVNGLEVTPPPIGDSPPRAGSPEGALSSTGATPVSLPTPASTSPFALAETTFAPPLVTGDARPAATATRPASAPPAPMPAGPPASAGGLSGAPAPGTLTLIFGALLGVLIAIAAPALGRRLRATPAPRRPTAFVPAIERPG
jgi:hypothetical protein